MAGGKLSARVNAASLVGRSPTASPSLADLAADWKLEVVASEVVRVE